MFSSATDPHPRKSDRTRAHLRAVALASFLVRGYDATTMRSIADEAGVSVGNAYHHFATKNDLVQELYLEVQNAHRAAVGPELEDVGDLVDRIAVVYRTGLGVLSPYRPHAPEFVSAALSPKSDMNPLSDRSSAARAVTVALFEEAVAGAKRAALPDDVARALPGALFLGHLLLALFWAYDDSPGQARSSALLDRGLSVLRLALPFARLPLARRLVRELLELIGEAGR